MINIQKKKKNINNLHLVWSSFGGLHHTFGFLQILIITPSKKKKTKKTPIISVLNIKRWWHLCSTVTFCMYVILYCTALMAQYVYSPQVSITIKNKSKYWSTLKLQQNQMIVWTLLSMSFAVVIDEMQIRTSIVIWYVMLNQYKKFSHLTFIHKCMHCCHGFHGWTINFAHGLPHLAKNFVSVKKKTNKQTKPHAH